MWVPKGQGSLPQEKSSTWSLRSGEVPGWDGVCKGQLMEDIYLHTRELEIDPIGNGNILWKLNKPASKGIIIFAF